MALAWAFMWAAAERVPSVAGAVVPDGERVEGGAAPESSADGLPGQILFAQSRQLVREAQLLLSELGYAPGPADGFWGPRTANAYRSFLREAGLSQATRFGADVLDRMRAEAARRGPPRSAVIEAEELLALLGYRPGPADGVWDEASGRALRRFLQDAGLPPEDRLSPATLRAIQKFADRRGGAVHRDGGAAAPPEGAVRKAQQLLDGLGYAPGPINGAWTPETKRAWGEFLRDAGLPAGAGLTPAGLRQLSEFAAQWGIFAESSESGATGGVGVGTGGIGQSERRLHAAVTRGDIGRVRTLIREGADLDAYDGQGMTPLMRAVELEYLLLAESLLAAGADPNVRGPDGSTALHVAVRIRNAGMIEALLKAGASADVPGADGTTVLELVAREFGGAADLPPALSQLLRLKRDRDRLNDIDQTGASRLHRLAREGAPVDILRELLERGLDASLRDHAGDTALHIAAARHPDPEAIALLVAKGADPNARNHFGDTPLHAAAQRSVNPAVVEALLDAGADIHAREDVRGGAPIHWAAALSPELNVLDLLVARGADLRMPDAQGDTALHVAAAWRFRGPEAVRRLLRLGADPRARNNAGRTPANVANPVNRPALR